MTLLNFSAPSMDPPPPLVVVPADAEGVGEAKPSGEGRKKKKGSSRRHKAAESGPDGPIVIGGDQGDEMPPRRVKKGSRRKGPVREGEATEKSTREPARGDREQAEKKSDEATKRDKTGRPKKGREKKSEADRTVEALLSPRAPDEADKPADSEAATIVGRAENGNAMRDSFRSRRTRGSTFAKKDPSDAAVRAVKSTESSRRHSQRGGALSPRADDAANDSDEVTNDNVEGKAEVWGIVSNARAMQQKMHDRRQSAKINKKEV